MMSFFRRQFSDVIEWDEFREDMIFWKWGNNEIKKGSRLIIRPGQDAIFFNQGKIEGIFEDEGQYDIESEIIPFLSTLKGFKFAFNTGMRVEVLFVNTKEFLVNWGTQNAINIPTPQLPGGMPIRANGTFTFKVTDYVALIDKIAGVRNSYVVDDIRQRISTVLDQLLMKWISSEGKDMFNLQANSFEIGEGIQKDLDMTMLEDGISITRFNINSFNYPKEIQEMITRTASHSMVTDTDKYRQVEMVDGIASGKVKGGGSGSDMASMVMGAQMARDIVGDMNQQQGAPQQQQQQQQQQVAQQQQAAQTPANDSGEGGGKANFCPNCGTKTGEGNFCSNCGHKLVD